MTEQETLSQFKIVNMDINEDNGAFAIILVFATEEEAKNFFQFMSNNLPKPLIMKKRSGAFEFAFFFDNFQTAIVFPTKKTPDNHPIFKSLLEHHNERDVFITAAVDLGGGSYLGCGRVILKRLTINLN